MAFLYRTDGTIERLDPPQGSASWSLAELQTLIGGYVEIVRTNDGRMMVIDDMGKLKGKSLNVAATRLYIYGRNDPVVGDVLIAERSEVGYAD